MNKIFLTTLLIIGIGVIHSSYAQSHDNLFIPTMLTPVPGILTPLSELASQGPCQNGIMKSDNGKQNNQITFSF